MDAECKSCANLNGIPKQADEMCCDKCFRDQLAKYNGDMSPIVTETNWRDTVLSAIEQLPKDIQQSVGHYQHSNKCLIIRVSVEPIDENEQDSCISKVEVRWWDTRQEEIESYIQETPELSWLIEFETNRELIDKPSISIKPDFASLGISGVCPGNGTVELLLCKIQEAILNELYEGGGESMVGKDRKGRFVRDNGTYILDWQRPKRRQGRSITKLYDCYLRLMNLNSRLLNHVNTGINVAVINDDCLTKSQFKSDPIGFKPWTETLIDMILDKMEELEGICASEDRMFYITELYNICQNLKAQQITFKSFKKVKRLFRLFHP